MPRLLGLIGAILLLVTTFITLFLLAMEMCDDGQAQRLYTAFTRVGYLNLFALFFLWVGYPERGKWTTALVAFSMLGMSWIMVDGFIITEQVNFKSMAPCYGSYLVDGDYGKLVYFYGPYFGFFYLLLILALLYFYVIKMDLPLQLQRLSSGPRYRVKK